MATLFNTQISATYPGLIKTTDNSAITATLKQLTDGSGNNTGLFLNNAGDFKVTAILEWGSLKDTGTGVTITQWVTAANGIANFNNDTTVPTSAAVKTYVDAVVTASDLDFLGDSNTGTPAVDLDSQNFSVLGTTNQIVTSGANQTLTIGLPNSVTISGTYTGATFAGDLNGTINTATTATTQSAGNNSTKVATTAYVDSLDAASDLDFSGDSGTGDVTLNTQVLAITGTTNQIVTAASGQGLGLSLPSTVHRNLQGNVTGNVTGDLTGNVTATSVLANGVTATTQTSSDSSTKVATTAYVKGLNNASDLDFTTDSGSGAVVLNTETLSVLGTTNQINSAGSGQAITLSLPSTVHRNIQGNVTGDLTGNADTATAWETARNLSVTGEATGTLSNVNGTQAVSGAVTLDNNSVTGKVLTGLPTPAASTVLPADSILEGIGKLQSQINGIANGLQFQGSWDADQNSPNLVSGGGEADSGTTTATLANKLVDTTAGQNFLSTVSVGDKIINQVDRQTALVTNVDSNTVLSINADIMLSGEAYTIDNSPFITQGHYYVVNVGGNTSLNGISTWSVGDWVIAGATNVWEKLDHTDVEGVGTPGNIAKWSATGTIADSIIAESGAAITVTGSLSTTTNLNSGSNFAVATNKFTANATTGNVAFPGDLAINTNKFTVNATSGDSSIAGNLSVSGIGSSFNTGNSGTFVTNDSSGYPRITTTNSTAQLGLFRSGGSAGGMYIGADSGGLEIMTSAFATKFSIDNSGNLITTGTGTFAGDVTLNNSSGSFGAEAILKGTTSTGTPKAEIAFKRGTSADGANMVLRTSNSSGTIQDVLTLDTSKNATFAGSIEVGAGNSVINGDLYFGVNADIFKSSGDLKIDVDGDISLDAGGNDIRFKVANVEFGKIKSDSGNLAIFSSIQDEDILFKGNDGGSVITALTLDMSNGGAATFREDIAIGGKIIQTGTDGNTFAGTVTSNAGLITSTSGGDSFLISKSTSTTGRGFIKSIGDTGSVLFSAVYGSSSTGTIFGNSLTRAAVIVTTSDTTTHPTSLLIGTFTSVPLVLGTNNTQALKIDTSQTATFAGNVALTGSGAKIISAISSDNDSSLFLSGAGSGKDTHIVFGGDRNLYLSKSSSATAVSEGTPVLTLGSDSNATFAGNVTISPPTNGAEAKLILTSKSAAGNSRTGIVEYDADTEKIFFINEGSTVAAMTSGGNVGIGTDSPTSQLFVNNTSDGDKIRWGKSDALVGSVGTFNGVPYIGYQGGAGGGIMFNGSSIEPTALGSSRTNNANDIGSANHSWRNAYLGGGIFLGGTGNANKLNDYEEGTWTPTFVSGGTASGTMTGKYTKIGRQVTVYGTGVYTAITGDVTLAGLPFTNGNLRAATVTAHITVGATAQMGGTIQENGTQMFIPVTGTYSGGGISFYFGGTYFV